jgi:hypothetical protein
MGLLLLLAACADTQSHHASNDANTLRRKTVHSPYIAASGQSRDTQVNYVRQGEYRTYGQVDAQQAAPIASGPGPQYAPAEVSPTGAHRTVIDSITNQPIKYGEPVTH